MWIKSKTRKSFTVYWRDEGHQTHFAKFFLFYLNIFFSATGSSILYATLFPYIIYCAGDYWVLSFALCLFAVGELISSPLFVTWISSRLKVVLLLSLCLGFLSGGLYSTTEIILASQSDLLPLAWLIVLARFLAGVARGGQTSSERTFLSRYTNVHERESKIAYMKIAASFGTMAGPALGYCSAFLDEKVPFKFGTKIYGYLDELTIGGYLLSFFNLISFSFWLFLFKENRNVVESSINPGNYYVPNFWQQNREKVVHIWVLFCCLVSFFASNLILVMNESIVTPILLRGGSITDFSLTPQKIQLVFLAIGGIHLVVNILLDFVLSRTDHRVLCLVGLLLQTIGCFLMIDWISGDLSRLRFFFGIGITNIGFPISRKGIFMVFIDLAKHDQETKTKSWIVIVGILSRVVGPFWTIYGYFLINRPFVFVFGGIGGFCFLCFVLMAVSYPKLKAREDDETVDMTEDDSDVLLGSEKS